MDADTLYCGDDLNKGCIHVTTGSVEPTFGTRAHRP